MQCKQFFSWRRGLHEILTYMNVYICKVGVPPSQPLIFPFDPLQWVNY